MNSHLLTSETSTPHPDVGEPILVIEGLRKSYGDHEAVCGIDITVRAGDTFVIVGPNGSGKTTTIECIEGLRTPSAGRIELMGHAPTDPPAIYNRLFGAQLQESSLPARIRAREALELFASFSCDAWDPADLLDRVGLVDSARTFFDNLSGGQKRRLMLALALVGKPPLLLLDEPTSGLDPHARLAMWNLLTEAKSQGTTIVLATHDLSEAQDFGDQLCMLHAGRVALSGRPSDLLEQLGHTTRVRAPGRPGASSLLASVPGCDAVLDLDGAVFGFGGDQFASHCLAELLERSRGAGPDAVLAGELARNLTTGPVRLEDVYLIQTGAIYAAENDPKEQ